MCEFSPLTGRLPLVAVQPMNQRSQIDDCVREMPSSFVLMARRDCMLARQVEEHGRKASATGEVEIFLTEHPGR